MQEESENDRTASRLNFRGIHLTDAGKYAEAIASFTEALGLDPSMSGIFFNRAEAKRLSGDYEGAKGDLGEALRLSPEEPDYLHGTGLLAYESDDFETALVWYEKAIAKKPDFAQAWNDKGVVHFRKAEYDRARECFEKAVGFEPEFVEALYNLVDTYDEIGLKKEKARALEALQKARARSGGGDEFKD
jgi:tetratricopeptide (TPR) repeat protein